MSRSPIVTTVALILGVTTVHAQQSADSARAESEATLAFDIPSQPLARALSQFGDMTRFQLVYEASLANGKRSTAVSGTLTPRAALERLLEGTGLSYKTTAPRTVTLEKVARTSGARVLGPIQVEGRQLDLSGPGGISGAISARGEQELESNGYRPLVAGIASGAPRAVDATPRSISVLTPEQIQKQDIQTFDEALKRLPGVTYIQTTVGSPTILSRGYSLSKFQVDGGAPFVRSEFDLALMDLGAYERVELVRGPNGAQAGQDSPGGTVNLVRKRPTSSPRLSTNLQLGQWDFYRGEVDYSTPALFDSPFGFRAVASYEDRNFFYEKAARNSANVYAIADVKPLEPLKLEFGGSYNDVESDSNYDGTPRYLEGALLDVPRTTNFTPQWAFQDARSSELFTRAYWDIAADWKLQGGVRYARTQYDDANYNRQVFLSEVTKASPPIFFDVNWGAARTRYNTGHDTTYDLKLNGRFRTFGLQHDVALTADLSRSYGVATQGDWASAHYHTNLQELIDAVNAEPNTQVEPRGEAQSWSEQRGMTLVETVSWRDRVDVTYNLRHNGGDATSKSLLYPAPPDILEPTATVEKTSIQDEWRPSYAAGVNLPWHLRLFATYAQGSSDQSKYYSFTGPLDPLIFANREIGLRFGDQRLLATLTYYELTTENGALSVRPSLSTCGPLSADYCYYSGGATAKSTGIDFDASGALTDRLSLVASFNYNSSKTTYPEVAEEPLSTQTPSRTVKLWLDWKPARVPKLAVQLGVSATSRYYEKGTILVLDPDSGQLIGESQYSYDQKAYAVIDVGAQYAISHRLNVALFGENLTDRSYCQTMGPNCFYGTPRSAKLTVRADW